MKPSNRIWIVLFLLGAFRLGADPDPRLAAIDALASFPGDFSAVYTVVNQDAEGALDKRVVVVYRRDARDTFVVVTREPASSRGKGYLRIGNSLWLYDPRDKQFILTGAKERFEAGNARLSDFSGSDWAGDYRIAAVRQEVLGRFSCQVYDLEALRSDVVFPKTVLWVSEEGLVRKVEDFSLSGQPIRKVMIPTWQKLGDHWAPNKVLILEELRKEATQITITQPSTAPVSDLVFSRAYLERVNP